MRTIHLLILCCIGHADISSQAVEHCEKVNLFLVLDNSGSMREKLDDVKAIARKFVARISRLIGGSSDIRYTLITQLNKTTTKKICAFTRQIASPDNPAEGGIDLVGFMLRPMEKLNMNTMDLGDTKGLKRAITKIRKTSGFTVVPYTFPEMYQRLSEEQKEIPIGNRKNVLIYISDGENEFRFSRHETKEVNEALEKLKSEFKVSVYSFRCNDQPTMDHYQIANGGISSDRPGRCYNETLISTTDKQAHFLGNLKKWSSNDKVTDCGCKVDSCRDAINEIVDHIKNKLTLVPASGGCPNITDLLELIKSDNSQHGLTYMVRHNTVSPLQCHFAVDTSDVLFACEVGAPSVPHWMCWAHDVLKVEWFARVNSQVVILDLAAPNPMHLPRCENKTSTLRPPKMPVKEVITSTNANHVATGSSASTSMSPVWHLSSFASNFADNSTAPLAPEPPAKDPDRKPLPPGAIAGILIAAVVLFLLLLAMLLYRRRRAVAKPRSKSDGVEANVQAKSEGGQASLSNSIEQNDKD